MKKLDAILPRLKEGPWFHLLRQADLLRRTERFAESETALQRVLAEAPAEFFEKRLAKGGREAIEEQLRLVREEKRRGERRLWHREELLAILAHPSRHPLEKRDEAAQRRVH